MPVHLDHDHCIEVADDDDDREGTRLAIFPLCKKRRGEGSLVFAPRGQPVRDRPP
jgi:hypothetical protein